MVFCTSVDEMAKLKAAHADKLEKRELEYTTEVSKFPNQVENLTNTLGEVNKISKEQHDNMSKAVRLAEETLASHLDEINAVYNHVLGNYFSPSTSS